MLHAKISGSMKIIVTFIKTKQLAHKYFSELMYIQLFKMYKAASYLQTTILERYVILERSSSPFKGGRKKIMGISCLNKEW